MAGAEDGVARLTQVWENPASTDTLEGEKARWPRPDPRPRLGDLGLGRGGCLIACRGGRLSRD